MSTLKPFRFAFMVPDATLRTGGSREPALTREKR
jgi:hypothetical protein